jgi:glutathione S-transferase/RNA polymerase-associated protein
MVELFEHPLSPYARKVKILLHEKGIPFERRFVNPAAPTDDRLLREWARTSPRLEVPTLVDGDARIFDSTVIVEYLEERWPEPAVQPASAAERARVRMLEEICDTELEAVNWGLMEVRFFRRAEGEAAEKLVATARRQLARLFGRLERELAGREWMNGARFGRGDAAVHPHVAGSAFWGFPVSEEFPRLRAWSARAAERESVRRDAADVAEWIRANLGGAGARPGSAAGSGSAGRAAMPIARQYRDHRLEWMMKSGGVEIVLEGLRSGTIRFAEEHR